MQIERKDADLIIKIIRQHLSANVDIFFFGSRVNGSFRKESDIDVLLKGIAPIDLGILSLVKEELEESDIPFKVDILDYHRCSKKMLKNISKSITGPL